MSNTTKTTTYRWRMALSYFGVTRRCEQITGRGVVTPGPDRSLEDVREDLISRAQTHLMLRLNDRADELGVPRRSLTDIGVQVDYLTLELVR